MSFKFTVTTTPASLYIPDSAKAAADQVYLVANLRQIAARLDARGQPLPKGVDLKDTGALLSSGVSSAQGYSFNTNYAQFVDERYHFAGLSSEYERQADQSISQIWDKEPLEIIEE